MDTINILELECYAKHGVLKEEKVLGQKFLVSIEMNIEKFSDKDDLDKTVDYSAVCVDVQNFMKENSCKLIETVSARIADMILMKYEIVKSVIVEVKKPWAPIGMPLNTVSTKVIRKKHKVYLGLGCNMGNKMENIKAAIDMIDKNNSCKVVKCSSLIETKPYGFTEQDDFLNGVMLIYTTKSPKEILELIGEIEIKLNRVRTIHWGPRTIDVDILLYDDCIINTKKLTIPHCEMHLRQFVLEPFCEIAPEVIHPVLKKTMLEIFENLSQKE